MSQQTGATCWATNEVRSSFPQDSASWSLISIGQSGRLDACALKLCRILAFDADEARRPVTHRRVDGTFGQAEPLGGPGARPYALELADVDRNGRVDIARGLVEEALALDLRRVPTELRFELSRRQQQLRSPL